MATILTPLRGDRALSERWAAAVKKTGNRDGVIAAVHTNDDAAIVEGIGGKVLWVTPFEGGPESARVNYIAAVYDMLIKAAKSSWVILWDDDILPSEEGEGFTQLVMAARAEATKSVGVVSIYPYANDPVKDYVNLFWRPYSSAAHITTIPIDGRHQVWGGGTGFSIWSRQVLLGTLPWSVPDGSLNGWDWDLAIKLEEKSLRVVAECSIRCRHDTLP